MTFAASLRSEFLKTKRTSVIYLILIAAFFIPFVLVLDFDSPPDMKANGWDEYYIDGFRIFAFLFLPLFFILMNSLIMQIEYRNHAWKQVLTSPQSIFHVLLAKFMVIQIMALVFVVVFNLFMVLGCALAEVIYAENLLGYLNQWPELIQLNLMALGATAGIGGLSFWLALRFSNFIAPIAIGFLLWLIGPTAAFELQWSVFDNYVFVLPFSITADRFEGERIFYQVLSLGYSVLFYSLAYLEFSLQRKKWSSILNIKENIIFTKPRKII